MFGFLDVPAEGAYHLVSWLAGATGVALAIVLFTMGVRLMLHPLARMAARGQKARTALEPQARKLREKHKHNPERMQRELVALYQESGTSVFAGCLPMLSQIPFFMVMYHLFSSATIGGTPNDLMVRTLFGTPLSSHFLATGSVVFVGLAVVLLVAGYFSAKLVPPEAPRLMRLLPYGTSLAVSVLPLAAGIYLATTTVWTVVERFALRR
jgi:YidC/Oxa1 family membrane protein insertase